MRIPRVVVVVAVAAAACSASPDLGTVVGAQTSSGSLDPIDHLRVIAAPEMAGRGTPSVGLERAADYIVGECIRAGLRGGVSEKVYKQPFTIGLRSGPTDAPSDEDHLGHELFEDGVFLSGDASAETRRELTERACRAPTLRGEPCPIADGDDPRPLLGVERAAQPINNVVAVLPGTGPHADEIVLMSAHLDHLGPGFPGADDNGSGSATLVAIMHRLVSTRAERPLDRSVAFLWTAGEERGLLGSAYFVDNPPAGVALAKIKQVINLDAVGALEDWRFSVLVDGAAQTETTAALAAEASRELDPPFSRINRDLSAFTRRQDGYSFVRKRIPTIWVFEGLTNIEGGGSLMPRYHRATDTVDNMIADNGGRKIRRMTAMLTSTVEKVAGSAPVVDGGAPDAGH